MTKNALLPTNIIRYSQLTGIVRDFIKHPPKKGCIGIIGAPGIGKTQGIEDAAHEAGKGISYIAAPLYTPGDLLGAAFPIGIDAPETHGKTKFLPTEVLEEGNVIFFDELPNADRPMQNIANRILLDAELNKRRFPEARIFAGNPPECSEMADPLPNILVNKAFLFQVDYRWDDFIRYATGATRRNIHPLVVAFINETKDRYLQVKDFTPTKHAGVATPAVGSPFPSPRSYDLLSELLHRIDRGLDMEIFDAAYSTIGSEAGKAFGDYAVTYKFLPKLSDVVTGKGGEFPAPAMNGGVVLLPLQMMSVFGLIGAADGKTQFRHGVEWLFEQFNKGTVTKDLVRSFWTHASGSHHKEYAREVMQEVAKKLMKDPKALVEFIKDVLDATAKVSGF